LNSDDARTRWRDILDAANRGEDVIITRYGKPN
jgi:prevent-host-death family protein